MHSLLQLCRLLRASSPVGPASPLCAACCCPGLLMLQAPARQVAETSAPCTTLITAAPLCRCCPCNAAVLALHPAVSCVCCSTARAVFQQGVQRVLLMLHAAVPAPASCISTHPLMLLSIYLQHQQVRCKLQPSSTIPKQYSHLLRSAPTLCCWPDRGLPPKLVCCCREASSNRYQLQLCSTWGPSP